jgi:hypothetical protein
MKEYTVRLNGNPVKKFIDETEAKKFMVNFIIAQQLHQQSLALVDEAVLKSDLSEANTILKHIMEKK